VSCLQLTRVQAYCSSTVPSRETLLSEAAAPSNSAT
jgi:hypothetical protein